MKHIPYKLAAGAVVGAALLAQPFLTVADVAPEPTLGETITVSGTGDAAPTACSGTGTVTCANLRSAIVHANTNDNGTVDAPKYDRIVLANGSVHTLSVTGAGEDAAATGDLDVLSHLTIETEDNEDTASKATIAGGEGFGDRLLESNSGVVAASVVLDLNNIVLTKGQAQHMNGGALYANDGAVTNITYSTITDNQAVWDGDPLTMETQGSGGGIYSKGALNISYSTFSKNDAQTILGTEEGQKNGNGGAIYASQATTVSDSTIGGAAGDGNLAVNGGGIQMAGGNKLEIVRTTFSNNDAVSGGGVNVVSPSASPFTITNSTFSGNHVTDSGAGINTNASVVITNTTIAHNIKDSGNKGAGINLVGGTVTLKNTLLAYNLGDGASANCGKVGSGALAVVSNGGNISTDATCNLNLAGSDEMWADVKIGALALNDNELNGTWTHALLTGSPAIDNGLNEGCPSTDQRGFVRPFDALVLGTKVCDVGAYEVYIDRADLGLNSVIADPARVPVGEESTIDVVVMNNASTAANSTILSTQLPGGLGYVSGTFNDGAGSCSAVGQVVTCEMGALAAESYDVVELVVAVNAAGANEVTFSVTSAAVDPFPSNNEASVTVTGLTNADLNLTATGDLFTSGRSGDVALTVLNQGPGDAKNVVLTATIPDGVTVTGISDTGACTFGAATVSCTFPEMLANASRTVTATVTSSTSGTYTATATVTGDVVDADSADNSITATIKVVTPSSDGGGCAVNPRAPFDPMLPGLLAAALAALLVRRRRAA